MQNTMNKSGFLKKIVIGTCALALYAVPAISIAAGFVPIVPECQNDKCEWEDLIKMGQNILNDAVYLAAILAVVSIAYAGYLYVTSGGSDSQIKKAHDVFGKVIWGIFLTLGAWLIVHEVLKYLGVTDPGFSLLK